ncbi:MAG: glycoside hydrolase family protein [Faecalibacterium sp.]
MAVKEIFERLPAPVNGGFKMEGYWVWCGSVVKGDDGKFHMFSSRWPKGYPMHPGWLIASEIVHAVSDTAEGPYQFESVALPARGAEYWDGRSTHNPSIQKHGDTYVLYYTGITFPFPDPIPNEPLPMDAPSVLAARASKRIGIATAKSPYGPWTRYDAPMLQTRPGYFDSFLTGNAAPVIHEDGSVVLMYKSRTYNKPPHTGAMYGDMHLAVATAPHYTGPYTHRCEEALYQDVDAEFEDPFIWKDERGYHMVAKDMAGDVCGQLAGGVRANSADGIHWQVEQDTRAYSRKVLWDDGIEREQNNLERPFILFQEGKATHMFFATADGTGGFVNAKNTWNMCIPLK